MMYFNFDYLFCFFKYGPHSLDFYFYFRFFCEFVDLEIFNLALHFNIWWYFRFWASIFWFEIFILDTFIKIWFILNFIIRSIILVFFNFITRVYKYFFFIFFVHWFFSNFIFYCLDFQGLMLNIFFPFSFYGVKLWFFF